MCYACIPCFCSVLRCPIAIRVVNLDHFSIISLCYIGYTNSSNKHNVEYTSPIRVATEYQQLESICMITSALQIASTYYQLSHESKFLVVYKTIYPLHSSTCKYLLGV